MATADRNIRVKLTANVKPYIKAMNRARKATRRMSRDLELARRLGYHVYEGPSDKTPITEYKLTADRPFIRVGPIVVVREVKMDSTGRSIRRGNRVVLSYKLRVDLG